MDVALLNIHITFQKNEVKIDEIGNHKTTWKDYYSCFATVSGEGGNEKVSSGMIVEDSDISFTTRYCKTLLNIESTKYRIIFNGNLYNISSIDHMNFKKKCLKFKCQKVRR